MTELGIEINEHNIVSFSLFLENAEIKKDKKKSKKAENQVSARDYEDIYKDMDIDIEDLGCIMLDLKPLKITQYVEDLKDDLFENPKFDQGALPAETTPHVTLLYGLLENGNKWKTKVDKLLSDWTVKTVKINEVGFFETSDSFAIIAHLEKTPELVDGHERLTLLPHVNTFSEYLPHMTLAYISKEADPKKWVEALGKQYNNKTIKALGINYGDKPDKKETTKSSLSLTGQDHNSLSQTGLILAENALDSATRDIITGQENSLRDGFASIERDIIEACVSKVQKNYLEQPGDVITQAQRKQFEADVEALLTTFYINLYPLFGRQLLSQRASEYGYVTSYEMTTASQAYIEEMAQMAAVSHVNTVIQDILIAASLAYTALVVAQMLVLIKASLAAGNIKLKEQLPNNPTDKQILAEINKGTFDNTDMYKEAQKLAREGAGQAEIVKAIRDKYADISKNRATTIARTESARVFNQSQYEADKQFLVNSGLMDKAYKKLRSRTGTPCIHCKALINKPPIPFTQNFADLNTTLTATETSESGEVKVKHLPINWEPVTAGNVHPNCNCEYVLIIK